MLVVDNGSPGGQASRIAESCGARALRLGRNVGFAGGVNAGVAATTGDVVALLNDDAVAGAGWIEASVARLEDDTVAAVAPRVVLAGRYLEIRLGDDPFWVPGDARPFGRRIEQAELGGLDVLAELVGAGIYGLETADGGLATGGSQPPRWRWTAGRLPFYVPLPDGSGKVELRLNGELVRPMRVVDLTNSVGSYLRGDGYVGDIGADRPDDEHFDVAEERFALSGTAFVTRRETLQRVGGFETRFFAYYEDTDWCWRARLMGLRLLYEPSVQVRHVRGGTSGGVLSRRVRFYAERNRLLTLVRNAPLALAVRETWRKRIGGGDDGVAAVVSRIAPRAFGERVVLRRRWLLSAREVFDRWAGVDVPVANL